MNIVSSIRHKFFFRIRQMARLLGFQKMFVVKQFEEQFGRKPNLSNPQTFNEKIQWLKVYDHNPMYIRLTDKLAVREFVKTRVGEAYLNDLLGVYQDVEEIQFDLLPEQFVLKATHGSGYNIICPDKSSLDWDKSKQQLAKWLRSNFYYVAYEWAYKHITPRIICEKFLTDKDGGIPRDYKIFCFKGSPRFLEVHSDRFGDHHLDLFTAEWSHLPVTDVYPTQK